MDKWAIYNSILVFSIFVLGVLVSHLFNGNLIYSPFSSDKVQEHNSPNDWISEENIHVYKDYVRLDLKNTNFIGFEDTGSMDPTFDSEANALEIIPISAQEINPGDIISFKARDGKIYVHRVIEKGTDSEGVYFITKGDNNSSTDPYKIRFFDVVGVVIAIFY